MAMRRNLSRVPAAGSGAGAGGSGSASGMSVRTMAESPREVKDLMSGTHQPVGWHPTAGTGGLTKAPCLNWPEPAATGDAPPCIGISYGKPHVGRWLSSPQARVYKTSQDDPDKNSSAIFINELAKDVRVIHSKWGIQEAFWGVHFMLASRENGHVLYLLR